MAPHARLHPWNSVSESFAGLGAAPAAVNRPPEVQRDFGPSECRGAGGEPPAGRFRDSTGDVQAEPGGRCAAGAPFYRSGMVSPAPASATTIRAPTGSGCAIEAD